MQFRGLFLTLVLVGLLFPDLSTAGDTQSPRKVTVYYFHTSARCRSCLDMEKWTGEVVKTEFTDLFDNGALVWKPVNVEKKENRHFIGNYKLYTKSVILSETVEGRELRYKNLDRVWKLLRDKESLQDYVRSELREFMKGP